MATILLRVPVDADPVTVYETVSTPEGVNGWWSNHTEGPEGEGSPMKVAFPDAPITFDFTVSAEVPEKRVAWRCDSWAQILPRLKKLAETGERAPFFDW